MSNVDGSFTSFTSFQIKPGETKTVKIPENTEFYLRNISIGNIEKLPQTGRIVLYYKVNDKPELALVPFLIGKFENAATEIEFGGGDQIVFRTEGDKVPIDIVGNILHGFSLDIQ